MSRARVLAAVIPKAHTPAPFGRRLRAAASAWLPMLVMTLLALGSWWLVKNTPVPAPDRRTAPPRHEPDYTMQGFSVQRFASDGSLRVRIDGDTMRHYPDTDTLEIENIRLHAVGRDGRVLSASAQLAVSDAGTTDVQLRGAARVVRAATTTAPEMVLTSEYLHADLVNERLLSHRPVSVVQGPSQVQGEALDYDHRTGIVRLEGRVRANFAAPATRPPER